MKHNWERLPQPFGSTGAFFDWRCKNCGAVVNLGAYLIPSPDQKVIAWQSFDPFSGKRIPGLSCEEYLIQHVSES